jgi:hypothetical protein
MRRRIPPAPAPGSDGGRHRLRIIPLMWTVDVQR